MSSNWGMDIEIAGILKQCGGQPTGIMQQAVYDVTPVYGPKYNPPGSNAVDAGGGAGCVAAGAGAGARSSGAGQHYVQRPKKQPSALEARIQSMGQALTKPGERISQAAMKSRWYKQVIALLAVAGAILAGSLGANTPEQGAGFIVFMALIGAVGGGLTAPLGLGVLRFAFSLLGGAAVLTAYLVLMAGGFALLGGAVWLGIAVAGG